DAAVARDGHDAEVDRRGEPAVEADLLGAEVAAAGAGAGSEGAPNDGPLVPLCAGGGPEDQRHARLGRPPRREPLRGGAAARAGGGGGGRAGGGGARGARLRPRRGGEGGVPARRPPCNRRAPQAGRPLRAKSSWGGGFRRRAGGRGGAAVRGRPARGRNRP